MRVLVVGLLALGLGLPMGVSAETLSTKSRAKLFKSQTKVLDSRARQQYNNSVRLKPQKVITPTKWGDTLDPELYRALSRSVFADGQGCGAAPWGTE